MKKLLLLLPLTLLLVCCESSRKTHGANDKGCLRGKLVIKGICGQRVIEYIDGDSTGLQLNAAWADESRSDTLKNVFAVANTCDFPESLNVGDTVLFRLSVAEEKVCMQCKAYTPVPEEKNKIEICEALR